MHSRGSNLKSAVRVMKDVTVTGDEKMDIPLLDTYCIAAQWLVIAVVVDVVVERSEGTADWRAWVTAATSRYSAWSNVPAENWLF